MRSSLTFASTKRKVNPVWNEEFDLLVSDPHLQALEIVVSRDKGDKSTNHQWKDVVPLKHLIPEEKKTYTLDLFKNMDTNISRNKKPFGKIMVEIMYRQIRKVNQGGGLLVVTIHEGYHLEQKNPIIYLQLRHEIQLNENVLTSLKMRSLEGLLVEKRMLFLYRHMDQMVVWTIVSKTLENLSEPSTSFPSPADSSSYSSIKRTQPCLQYKFHEIQLAINNFDETLVVGKGRSGKVYKGNVSNGSSLVVAAIKRMDSTYNQGADELWSEVEMLSTFRHCNIASLIGYCKQGEEMILVYEYIPNGSLYDHLHKLVTPLSWLQRLNICIHAGHGLHYLQTGIEVGVIHRDIKSSNVLLDESWTAKIADLGLAMIVPR
ncbi:receptor-like protein kinase FERONIA, partial [Tanacetum coccineum]